MTESQILTLNERVKGFPSCFFNLSAALVTAGAARMWVKRGVDLPAPLAGHRRRLAFAGMGLPYPLEAEIEETP